MKVEVIKSYLWAPDGIHVRRVDVGEVIEGEGAEIALQMGCGREVKALPEPTNKSLGNAPKNKGR